MMKYLLLLSIIFLSCASWTRQEVGKSGESFETGIYRYKRDSVENPNPRFAESIELRKDNSFIYKTKVGSFIRLELRGSWEKKGDSIVLNEQTEVLESLSPKICSNDKGYLFDVKGERGGRFNYSLSINNGSQWLRDLNGPALLESDEEITDIQVVTSSGLHSIRFTVPKGSNCFDVWVSNKRYFNNEVWMIRGNKLQPVGFDRKLAKYYLYKDD